MKRFILCSLSATVALAFGSIAQAQTQMYRDVTEDDANLTEGIISPDDSSPNNRVIPGTGALEYDQERMEMNDDNDFTEGIISPDSNEPFNRAVPGESELDSEMMERNGDDDFTEGVISPEPNTPYNRTVPGEDAIEDNGTTDYDRNNENYRDRGNMTSPDEMEPTEGIISPDSDTPYNRAVPGRSELDNEGDAVDTSEDSDSVDGIIVPDSDEPYNREEIQ